MKKLLHKTASRIRSKISRKAKGQQGESLAEVMVAILIIAVGLLMVASMISASARIIEKSDAKVAVIYAGVNAMEEMTATGEGGYGGTLKLTRDASGRTERISVSVVKDEESGLLAYRYTGGEAP